MIHIFPLFVVCFALMFSSLESYAHTEIHEEVNTAAPVHSTQSIEKSVNTSASIQNAQQTPTYSLDHMLTNFKATKAKTVELALFKPISFTATIAELPYKRKHGYLAREIKRFSPNSNIIATQGITLVSETQQEVSVYIIDQLAQGMITDLSIGDSVNFEAYHVYNSMNGPGLLVYQWEKPAKQNLIKRTFTHVIHTLEHWFTDVDHYHDDANNTASTTQSTNAEHNH